MTLTITSTDEITELDGVPVRLWNGVTEGGIPVLVFVHRLAVHESQDQAAFERELMACPPPEPPLPISLRQVT
jgi:hypothetical protein